MTDNRYLHLIRQDCPLPPGTHVVVYCRDSGGDEQDRSVAQQVDVAREYCQHHNLVLDKLYVDESKLSSNTEKRDALQELLSGLRRRFRHINDRYKREKASHENPFGVIFWKSNRLGRDSIEATNIKTDLRLRGITIVDLVTSANTGNAAVDALIEAFQQWKDEQYLEEISQNAKRGLAQLVGTRDNDPKFLRYNPDWECTGGYLGIRPGGAPTGFKGVMPEHASPRLKTNSLKSKNRWKTSWMRLRTWAMPSISSSVTTSAAVRKKNCSRNWRSWKPCRSIPGRSRISAMRHWKAGFVTCAMRSKVRTRL
jgi:hypothetical protein